MGTLYISMGMLSMLLLIILLESEDWRIIIIAIFTMGLFLIPLYPLLLELGCELVYPIGEGSSNGF